MRTQKIYSTLAEFDYRKLKRHISELRNQELTQEQLDYLKTYVSSLNSADQLDFLQPQLDEFNKLRKRVDFEELSTLSAAERNVWVDVLVELVQYCSISVCLLEGLLPEPQENSICIKLPAPSDFGSIIASMEGLNLAISNVVANDSIGGKVEITSWTPGSFWLELALGSEQAFCLVSDITWSAAVVFKKFKEGYGIQQQIKEYGLKDEFLDDLLKAIRKKMEDLAALEAQGLFDDYFKGKSSEGMVENLKCAVKTFEKHIEDGGEIHPSFHTPKEIKMRYPDLNLLDELESKTGKQRAATAKEKTSS